MLVLDLAEEVISVGEDDKRRPIWHLVLPTSKAQHVFVVQDYTDAVHDVLTD